MATYKIIDGVVYEVKAIDMHDIEHDVEIAIENVEMLEKEISEQTSIVKKYEEEFEDEVASYKKQILGIQSLIAVAEEKKIAKIEPLNKIIEDCNEKIKLQKSTLIDKKAIIEELLPEQSKKLGL